MVSINNEGTLFSRKILQGNLRDVIIVTIELTTFFYMVWKHLVSPSNTCESGVRLSVPCQPQSRHKRENMSQMRFIPR